MQSLRILVHVYMQASSSSLNSVKVVMDADPRGAASREMPVANSVPIIVTCFDPFGGTRRGLEGPSQGLRLPSDGVRMTYARWLGFPEDTPAILSALFGRAARPRFDFKVIARIAL